MQYCSLSVRRVRPHVLLTLWVNVKQNKTKAKKIKMDSSHCLACQRRNGVLRCQVLLIPVTHEQGVVDRFIQETDFTEGKTQRKGRDQSSAAHRKMYKWKRISFLLLSLLLSLCMCLCMQFMHVHATNLFVTGKISILIPGSVFTWLVQKMHLFITGTGGSHDMAAV